MSFITEVYLSDDEEITVTETLNESEIYRSVSQNVSCCKADPNKYIQSIYDKHKEWSNRKELIMATLKEFVGDIHYLQSQIKNVGGDEEMPREQRTETLDALSKELQRSISMFRTLTNLTAIHDLLIKFKERQDKHQYIRCVCKLVKVEKYIDAMPDDELSSVITTLKSEVTSSKTDVKEKCLHLFEKNVKMVQSRPKFTLQRSMLKIKKNPCDLIDTLTVLGILKYYEPLKDMSNFFWKHVCKIIINHASTVKVDEDNSYFILSVTKRSPAKPTYKDVFSRLVQVFKFLYDNFNFNSDNLKTLNFIGNDIKYNLSNSLLKGCLKSKLPENDEVNPEYKEVIEGIKKFQRSLVDMGFLDPVHNPLVVYTNNMDVIFINKMCHEYLGDAITIIKKDLQTCVYVGVPYKTETPLKQNDFPECCVSTSTLELMELTNKLLRHASTEGDMPACKLICTLQSIFYQYGGIVCGHHERSLQNSPKHIGLFRNNCMYLAHQLTRLHKKYTKKLTSRQVLSDPLFFTYQAHQLRTLGGEIFLTFVEDHINQMNTTLREYHFTPESIAFQIPIDAILCVRHCTRQYELIKLVWRKILPPSVFNKTLGYLVQTFCQRLIDTVMEVGDIPPTSCRQLVEVFMIVLTRGPKLFQNQHDIRLHVENWQRFEGMIFVLSAPFNAVEEAWGDGKGQLTMLFSEREIKKLIKAVFKKNFQT